MRRVLTWIEAVVTAGRSADCSALVINSWRGIMHPGMGEHRTQRVRAAPMIYVGPSAATTERLTRTASTREIDLTTIRGFLLHRHSAALLSFPSS